MTERVKSMNASRVHKTSTWSFLSSEKLRPGLSRAKIIDAAITLIDARGLGAVSMRVLARELKASPMSLYHYVGSKSDLLNLMRDKALEEITLTGGKPTHWRELLSQYAWQNKRLYEKYKWLLHLPAEERQYGPEAIRILEWYLENLIELGFDFKEAVASLEICLSFTIGFVTRQRPARSGKNGKTAVPELFSPVVLALGKYPKVTALMKSGSGPASDDTFSRSLDWILNGIASGLTEQQDQSWLKQPLLKAVASAKNGTGGR
jgi:AcrR family transcriptional regulator